MARVQGTLRAAGTIVAPSSTVAQAPPPPAQESGPPLLLRLKANRAEIKALIAVHLATIDNNIMTGDGGVYRAMREIKALSEILSKSGQVWPAD